MTAIIGGMVTYCTGSARQKRAYFMRKDAIVLDNIEVVFCASEDGKNYFAYGEMPFSMFGVKEYLDYKTALAGGGVDYALLEKLGISTKTRVGRLCPAQMRCVQLAEKLAGGRYGDVVINLDGTRYSRKNAKALAALISVCENVFVCVTDKRFVSRAPRIDGVMKFGNGSGTRGTFYNTRALAAYCEKRYGIPVGRISVM